MPTVYNNTVCRNPSHFPVATQLIVDARSPFRCPSENWPYPTEVYLGTPTEDAYYSEVWLDGMDWQNSYWCVEQVGFNPPRAVPLIVFEDTENRGRFKNHNFNALLRALLSCRRDQLWLRGMKDHDRFHDTVWPYLRPAEGATHSCPSLAYYSFQHHSQPIVRFYVNSEFLPSK